MAKHSLGGLRSLDTLHAPDRVIKRLSPVQTWVLKKALEAPGTWVSLPPSRDLMRAMRRLVRQGYLVLSRDESEVRYRPLADDWVGVDPAYFQNRAQNVTLVASGRTRTYASE